ncbi:MAG: putative cysteine protease YraA [Candidatus Accumulibacter regalis]|jgi:protease I|uniref:Cysteine protease YraA n=1 Tax=Accumulibacter regalis TaxID=522306 RepID=A0A011P6J9_ACCRE|nr:MULTISPECIES: DJ-1/PfpI family protein [unclassified Candidatus Accumulibacter]EXI90603.1 MAG: putative cysteine protease YraA [Candidatus Accumulibacter regalis]MBL8366547.1 DJ-1/PfpI family protein [Accumulibacter sp.]MBN8513641.1 DJ-1/PfpI family protein [Accumulibacter sp.]MBO3704262.1 DJ-1/PfpI family protein [Accumulibacter sp.]HRE69222.1 DJ-1/PfpI family protein [Accumulibacter sp.]
MTETSPLPPLRGIVGEATKGRIGVLVEEHFDMTEYRLFNDLFPRHGYQVVYLSHLWGNANLTFGSNPDNGWVEEHVLVETEINSVKADEFKGIIIIGAYASDRLRYQVTPRKGEPNQAPAVVFLRQAMAAPKVKLGTICHSLWLLCADRALLQNRRVTCAHNIICDVENAGAEVIYGPEGTVDLVVDGNLITGKHPGITEQFISRFLSEIEKAD